MVLRHKDLMLSLVITHDMGRGWLWQGTSTAAQDTAHRTPGLLSLPEAAYTCCQDLHLARPHLSVSSSPSLLPMMNPFCEHQPYGTLTEQRQNEARTSSRALKDCRRNCPPASFSDRGHGGLLDSLSLLFGAALLPSRTLGTRTVAITAQLQLLCLNEPCQGVSVSSLPGSSEGTGCQHAGGAGMPASTSLVWTAPFCPRANGRKELHFWGLSPPSWPSLAGLPRGQSL